MSVRSDEARFAGRAFNERSLKQKEPRSRWMRTRLFQWSGGGSNSRPLHCERSALPAELPPQAGDSTGPANHQVGGILSRSIEDGKGGPGGFVVRSRIPEQRFRSGVDPHVWPLSPALESKVPGRESGKLLCPNRTIKMATVASAARSRSLSPSTTLGIYLTPLNMRHWRAACRKVAGS